MHIQQENIRQGNFYFPKYSISISQISAGKIGKLESIGKIILYHLSVLFNTLLLCLQVFFQLGSLHKTLIDHYNA